MCELDDLVECALCAACCYCCLSLCKGSDSSRSQSQPHAVVIQQQPAPGVPYYGGPGQAMPYGGGMPPQGYPPQQGPYYPPQPGYAPQAPIQQQPYPPGPYPPGPMPGYQQGPPPAYPPPYPVVNQYPTQSNYDPSAPKF